MKTDYTIMPEYYFARLEAWERSHSDLMDKIEEFGFPIICTPIFGNEQLIKDRFYGGSGVVVHDMTPLPLIYPEKHWTQVYDEARRSHAAGEPLIRTVCKIATRILFVLLIVGIAVGVLLK